MEIQWINHFGDALQASGRRHHWALPEPLKRADPIAVTETTNVEVYRSGVSTATDLRGFMMAKVPVGVCAVHVTANRSKVSKSPLSSSVRSLLVQYINEGAKVFVDSGAVGAFRHKVSLDFESDVFPVYQELLAKVDRPENLLLVMPDVLGDQDASLALQERHAATIRGFMCAGAEVMMPVQRGHLTPAQMFHRQADMLGTLNFAVGVPSIPGSIAAISIEELTNLMTASPKHVHLLGVAGNAKVFGERYGVIRSHSARAIVSCDACRLLAHVGQGRRLTDRSHNRAEDIALYAANDHSTDNPLISFSAYKSCVAYEPGFLSDEEVSKLGVLINLTAAQIEAWTVAARAGALMDEFARLDPDEEWLDDVLTPVLFRAIYLPKMKSMIFPAARSSEIAKLTREGIL